MPILFSAVACDRIIVAQYASCEGNFTEITEEVLIKIPVKNGKMTYSHGHYLLHYIADNELFYFCITAKTCQRSRAFLFLNEIQRRFSIDDGPEFCKLLADEMYRYSEDYNTITVRRGELDEINTIGVGCSETLLGEKILMVENPDKVTYTVLTTLKETAQSPITEIVETTEKPKSNSNPNYEFYVIVIVTLIFMGLILTLSLSTLGALFLVLVACISILFVMKFPKAKRVCSVL